MHATGYKGNDTNMDNYVCHSFQARYLSGIAAGMMTKTNKIGVAGSHPIPEIIRNINALTLGAQSVNPDIEVAESSDEFRIDTATDNQLEFAVKLLNG